MKAWWKTQAARIDALSLRERVFLFICVLAAAMALADVAWLSPAQATHSQLKQRFASQSSELERLRESMKAEALKPSPGRLARVELDRIHTETALFNTQIQQEAASTQAGTPLVQVLEHFLRRHSGLTLVRTATLGAPTGKSAANLSEGLPNGLTRTGLELTVSGSFGELAAYVQTLEKSLPALRWGNMKLVSDTQPPVLNLQVYVLEVQP